jgi:hypothetical protein
MILVIALSALPVTNAEAAATPGMSKLTIDNKSLGQVTVTLKGPKQYTIYAKVGKTIQEIAKGNYVATFKACGTNQTVKVKATANAAKLQIKQCKTTLLTVANFSSSWLTMNMVGPDTYYFSVAPHQKEVRKVLSGTYKITATCGGRVYTPTWNVKGKKYLIYCRAS